MSISHFIPKRRMSKMLSVLGSMIAVAGIVTVFVKYRANNSPAHDGSIVAAAKFARLQAIARHIAFLNGDRHPSAVLAVATTARKGLAAAAPGITPGGGNQAVYVVTMRGNFIGYRLRHPVGSKIPRGKVFDIVVNASTYWVMAESLRSKYTDLNVLGKPFSLAWK